MYPVAKVLQREGGITELDASITGPKELHSTVNKDSETAEIAGALVEARIVHVVTLKPTQIIS